MEYVIKDFLGREIEVGDRVAYPTSAGSWHHMNKWTVKKVRMSDEDGHFGPEPTVVVLNDENTRAGSSTRPDRFIVINEIENFAQLEELRKPAHDDPQYKKALALASHLTHDLDDVIADVDKIASRKDNES